jgi:hypothetical protein
MSDQYTTESRTKLEDYLATHSLPSGLGDEESACTLAAINLALTGKLTDETPSCMSLVLGRTTIRLQDVMPNQMRNSKRYKRLIPDMPGTGRERETERLAVLMDWMWTVVLPQLQPIADKHGFGSAWRNMCEVKTSNAAADAGYAANAVVAAAAGYAAARAAAAAAAAGYAAARAADYAVYAANAVVAARAANAAALAADWVAANAAANAADAARAALAADANVVKFWEAVDPIGVLERMTYLGEGEQP